MTYDGTDNAVVYDFETLGTEPTNSVVVSLALVTFNLHRVKYGPDYSYQELLNKTEAIKFDVAEQVSRFKKKIDKDTLDWWGRQGAEAQKQLTPTKTDKSIGDLPHFFAVNVMWNNIRTVYTRNNTFDPAFMKYLHRDAGAEIPYQEWIVRDTKSTIDGMTWGQNIRDNFVPDEYKDGFIAHDPSHDVVMDVIRLQYLSRILIDEIPF